MNRWSQWINRDNPSTGNDDVERMTSQEMTQLCPGGHVAAVQCRSVQGIPVFDKEEGLVCNVKDGFVCSGAVIAPVQCNDYEIRYLCHCSGELCVGGEGVREIEKERENRNVCGGR